MARIHRRTIQKRTNGPDNHDGVITHLESDILECDVKWALGRITINKASGGDGIQAELFQILKDAFKAHIPANLENSAVAQDWKMSVFISIPKKRNFKECSNCLTLHSFHMLEISPGCSLEGLMLKLKLQYFGHLMLRVDSLEKTLILGGIGGRRRRGGQRKRCLDGITDSMDMS